jgi:hypothetical protein
MNKKGKKGTSVFPLHKGAFQSPIILATFSAHLATISNLLPNLVIDNVAEGALAMATTLLYSTFIMNLKTY